MTTTTTKYEWCAIRAIRAIRDYYEQKEPGCTTGQCANASPTTTAHPASDGCEVPSVSPAHTPGPWYVTPANAAGDCGVRSENDPGNTFYCDVSVGWGENARRVCAANARLIAAAPELLSMLTRYVEQEEFAAPYSSSPMREEARAIIAKAIGQH